MRRIIYLLGYLIAPILAAAQVTNGELRVTVKDSLTSKPLEYVNVGIWREGALVTGGVTDSLGIAQVKDLNEGVYEVKVSSTGYITYNIKDVRIRAERTTDLPVFLPEAVIEFGVATIEETRRIIYEPPPFLPEPIQRRDSIKNLPFLNDLEAVVNQNAGVFAPEGFAMSVAGNRPGGVRTYWNGIPLSSGLGSFPLSALNNVSLIQSGVSAEYGDFTGAAITVATPRPGLLRHNSIQLLSSSMFDKYHNNYAELFSMGPLIVKNKGRGDSASVKLGYLFAANYQYQADRFPSAIGVWRVKPDKLKELEAKPIVASTNGQGVVPAAEFVTAADLEKVSYHQNVPATTVSVLGELNFVPTERTQLLLGAKYDYANSINYNFGNNLFNFNNNSQSISHNLLTYANFINTYKPKEGVIKYANYSIRLDYQSAWNKVQDPLHSDNYFDYGYVGKFTTYHAPAFEYRGMSETGDPDTVVVNGQKYYLKNYYRQTGNRPIDTLVTFDRTDTRNPILANYTSAYYDLLGQHNINSVTDIRSSGGGLVNGQNPIGVYSNMWNNIGLGVQQYGKSQSEQVGINASGQVNTKYHEIRMGMYYEQRIQRAWSVNTNDLWTLMYQLANNGIALDTDNPTLVTDANGVFRDTVRYGYKQTASQSVFDKRLRESLISRGVTDEYGNPVGDASFVDIHSYAPGDFSLNMFSADELLNNGNGLVNYFGYDYTGNKTRGYSGPEKFTSDILNRPVSAYMPSYSAVFLQDKINFKDFIFRAGVRVERYDNNTPVLKDPFLLFPARTAGEVKELRGNAVNHPGSVGDDYTVYVDDARNPSKITGYRNGSSWYNAEGLQINDPAAISARSNSSTIQPYLVNPGQTRVDASAFKDFEPSIQVLPRLYCEFPINRNSGFFASYDVLAQRPANNFATIAQYYYLPFNPTGIIGNPDLKPQRSHNYELGFKTQISKHSALALTASYREQRNLIQLYRYNYAYPVSYTSFANIDFATVKSFTAQYMYRVSSRVDFDASYTLQFADGTGSSAGSQQALVSVGQPNLRTLFPLSFDVRNNVKLNVNYLTRSGSEYRGPAIGKFRMFENTGIVVALNAYSGLPFTPNQLPTPDAQSGIAFRSPIKGTPYGARLPWQLQNDVSVYRNVPVKLGRRDDGTYRQGTLKFTLQVNNLLNIKNIRGIHPYTGSAETDGWLNSEQGRKAINDATNAQAFADLYNAALANPGFYSLPRRMKLGVTLSF